MFKVICLLFIQLSFAESISINVLIRDIPESIILEQITPGNFLTGTSANPESTSLITQSTGALKVLDLTHLPSKHQVFNHIESCKNNPSSKECNEEIKVFAKTLQVDFIVSLSDKLNSPNCFHRTRRLHFEKISEVSIVPYSNQEHFNFRCEFNFPHELFLNDFHDISIEELKTEQESLNKFPIEFYARRFIDRWSFDNSIKSKIEINKIYDPAPITWSSWIDTTKKLVEVKARSESPLELKDLELWHHHSLSQVLDHQNNWEKLSFGFFHLRNKNDFHFFDSKKGIDPSEVQAFLNFKFSYIKDNSFRFIKKDCKSPTPFPCGRILFPRLSDNKPLLKLIDDVNKTIKAKASLNLIERYKFTLHIATQFVSMHPFYDGNGRVSKWLQDYMTIKLNLPYIQHFYMNKDLTLPEQEYFIYSKLGTHFSNIVLKKCQTQVELKRCINI